MLKSKAFKNLILLTSFAILTACPKQVNHGDSAYQAGDYQKALIGYQEYLSEHPNDLNSLEKLALLNIRQKNYSEAVKYWREAIIQNDPTRVPWQYFNLADCYLKLGDLEKAKLTFQYTIDYLNILKSNDDRKIVLNAIILGPTSLFMINDIRETQDIYRLYIDHAYKNIREIEEKLKKERN